MAVSQGSAGADPLAIWMLVAVLAGILGATTFAIGVGRWRRQGMSLREAGLHAVIVGMALGLAVVVLPG